MPSIWMPLVPKHQECADELSCMLDNSPPRHLAPKTARHQLKTTRPQIRPTRPQSRQLAPNEKDIFYTYLIDI